MREISECLERDRVLRFKSRTYIENFKRNHEKFVMFSRFLKFLKFSKGESCTIKFAIG